MPRKPTPAELRRVYDAAGRDWDELKRLIEAALSEPKKRRGPKQYVEPLLYIEALCRALEQQGMSRTEALTQLVRDTGVRGRGPIAESSTVKRLRDKLRDPQFQREFREKVVIKHYPRPVKVAELIRSRIKSKSE
jgi:hypothetical protein